MDSRKRLQARISGSSQKDVLLGIFFESTIDHMVTTLGVERADAIRSGIIPKKVISFFRYPVADLLRLLDGSIPQNATDAQFDQVVREYGGAAVTFFFASPVGKTMSILAGDSPHRLLSSAPSGFKAVTTFGERSYARLTDNSAELTFVNDLMGPAWECGVVTEAMNQLCQVQPKLEVKPQNESCTDFSIHVSW